MTVARGTTLEELLTSSDAQALLESVLGALPVPAWASDIQGVVVWQNDAARALVGELGGRHYAEAVPPNELARARETYAAVTVGGETRRLLTAVRAADGSQVRTEAITAPLRKDGRIVGMFGFGITLDEAPVAGDAGPQLSARQLDVLRLLVRGRSTRQIADELQLAPDTVRNYIAGLLKTLGARSRLEAVLLALREGLVSLDLD